MTTNLKQRVDAVMAYLDTANFIADRGAITTIITDLIALNKQLAEALEFYANMDNYTNEMQSRIDGSRFIVCNEGTDGVANEALQSYHQHGFGE
jgi:hypothetical protein